MRTRCFLPLLALFAAARLHAAVPVDVSAYKSYCGVDVETQGDMLHVAWNNKQSAIDFDLNEAAPLIRSISAGGGEVLRHLDPFLSLTVGSRENPPGRPPTMSVWNVFFDNPPKRPYQTFVRSFTKRQFTVSSDGNRAMVRVGEINAGSFRGAWSFTFFADSPLVKMEAVVSTEEDLRAYVFDLGLVGQECRMEDRSRGLTPIRSASPAP